VEPLDVGAGNASSSIASGVAVEVANVLHHSVPQSPRPANVDAGIQSPLEEEPDVVTLDDILDAVDCAVDEFEKLAHSRVSHPKPEVPDKTICIEPNLRKRKLPIFSDESSETEYSLNSESRLSISSPTFLETTECATSGYVGIHDVVFIHLSSDFDCSMDIG